MQHRLLSTIAFIIGCVPIARAETKIANLSAPTLTRDDRGVVTLKCDAPDTTLLYTLDGKEPVMKSNPYLAPIVLPGGGVVKARAFSADRKQMSEAATADFPPLPSHTRQSATVVPVTQDRSWPSYDWAMRHKATSAAVRAAKPGVLFIGDSITHFFGGPQFDKYPLHGSHIWDEFYAPRRAGNLGCGWEKTENVLWRLQHGAVDGIAPKVVVMMIGTNNSADTSAPDIAAGIRAICAELRARLPGAKILLLGIFPRGEKPNPQRDKIAEVNREIALLHGKDAVTYLDIGAKFLGADGTISKDIMPDFLHPNEKGYRIWAEAMEPTLRVLLGE